MLGYVHFRTMSCRCHRKIVSGVTMVAVLTQDLPSQPMPADRQASPVGVSEREAPLTQLASKDGACAPEHRQLLAECQVLKGERVIGSIRRECLNHVIVINEVHLRRTLAGYLSYYHYSRTHLSLAKDAPTPRRVQAVTDGDVIAVREVGGLHHRYERRAA